MLECRADLLSMACPTLQAFHSLDLKKGPQKLLAKQFHVYMRQCLREERCICRRGVSSAGC